MKEKYPLSTLIFFILLSGLPEVGSAQHVRSAVPDSLGGWYIPFDSATYPTRKKQPSCMHFMPEGKYEVFGIAEKGMQWMYKGSWRESNDTLYFYYDWSFDETIHAKYLSTLIESVPFTDTLVFADGKYHYADPLAGIPPFALVKVDFGKSDNIPVSEAADNIRKVYKKEIRKPAVMNRKKITGCYSWQGDAGQTTLKIKKNGKYKMYRGEMKMKLKEKGEWEEMSDTLFLQISNDRMFYVMDATPVRERKFLVNENGLIELKNQDVTADRHLYIIHRKFYRLFRHRFHRSLHG